MPFKCNIEHDMQCRKKLDNVTLNVYNLTVLEK
jgi:hypothetical protein